MAYTSRMLVRAGMMGVIALVAIAGCSSSGGDDASSTADSAASDDSTVTEAACDSSLDAPADAPLDSTTIDALDADATDAADVIDVIDATDGSDVVAETSEDGATVDSTPATDTFDATADDTAPRDSGIDTAVDDTAPLDTTGDSTVDSIADTAEAPPPLGTTGLACTSDAVCDPAATGRAICSSNLYPPDTTDPNPVCVGTECPASTSGAIVHCDGARGLCLDDGAAGTCSPICTYGTSGGAATGCVGKDACNPYGVEAVSGGKKGIGFCSGGCAADADCTAGDHCQKEFGDCVKTLTVFPKRLGDACNDGGQCQCAIDATGNGYCVSFCKVADPTATCPSGFTCDPGLLKPDFTAVPSGVAGVCLKNCTGDADCTALHATCDAQGATGVKVCVVGGR